MSERDPRPGTGERTHAAGASGAPPGEGRKLRPLHTPSPVSVRTDDRGRPTAVRAKDTAAREAVSGRLLEVVGIREVWRIDDEWWREPISRLYFEVVLENGGRAVLYRDLVDGGWYQQR